MENQTTGACSLEGYRHALQEGVRYLELDVWSNEAQDLPVVTNGYSRVEQLPLAEVLAIIQAHGSLATCRIF